MNWSGIAAFGIFTTVLLTVLWYRQGPIRILREWWEVRKFRWQMRKK